MFDQIDGWIAWRYLRARRSEGFLSAITLVSFIGIALGVATLITVVSVMNGFRSQLLGRIIGLDGHLVATLATGAPTSALDAAETVLRGRSDVRGISRVLEGQGLITANGVSTGVLLRAQPIADLLRKPLQPQAATALAAAPTEARLAIPGARLAATLAIAPATDIAITLLEVQTDARGGGPLITPRVETVAVAGTFFGRVYEHDAATIYLTPAAGERLFGADAGQLRLEVEMVSPDAALEAAPALAALMPAEVRLETWYERKRSLATALDVERAAMFFVLALIVLVAAFNIACSMIMLVREKTREIAILRTMGAQRLRVLRVFLLAGGAIGVVGTGVGVALGVALMANLAAIQQGLRSLPDFGTGNVFGFLIAMPAELHVRDVVVIAAIALMLSLLATLAPARRAAGLDPVVALRGAA